MNRALKRVSVFTTFIMFLAVLQGALVTNTGSADGCGAHWPLCKGTFMPEWDYNAIIEFSHRAVSGLAGMLSILLLVWIWRVFAKGALIRLLAVGTLGFVILQGTLGAMSVIWPQPQSVKALHFGFSIVCFALALLITVALYQQDRPIPTTPIAGHFTRSVWWTTAFIYGVTYLGAYVRHMRATSSCFGWPLCNGEVIPDLFGPVAANFAHRVAAAVGVILIVRLWLLAKRQVDRADLRSAASIALVLILMQVASGAVLALGNINVMTQMVHSALLTLLWGALNYLCLMVSVSPRRLLEAA